MVECFVSSLSSLVSTCFALLLVGNVLLLALGSLPLLIGPRF